MNDDMPWVIGLTDEEVQELRSKKQELTEYGKQKIRKLMDKKEPIVAKVSESDFHKIFEEFSKQNRKPTLWEVMRDQLGFSVDMCDEIVGAVEKWLPPIHDTNTYDWNRCLKLMQEKLR